MDWRTADPQRARLTGGISAASLLSHRRAVLRISRSGLLRLWRWCRRLWRRLEELASAGAYSVRHRQAGVCAPRMAAAVPLQDSQTHVAAHPPTKASGRTSVRAGAGAVSELELALLVGLVPPSLTVLRRRLRLRHLWRRALRSRRAGVVVGFVSCDICNGSCVLADGVSGLRSAGAAFGVTITDGGLKLDGIGSGRLGMNTGADSFSMGDFGGGGEIGADAFEGVAAGVAGSRGGIAGTNGSATRGI